MAAGIAEFIVRAKDEATRVIAAVTGQLEKLTNAGAGLKSAGVNLAVFNQAMQGIQTAQQIASQAMAMFGGDLAAQVENLDRLAKSTGTSINDIKALEFAFKNSGATSEDATTALIFMTKAIARNDELLGQMNITSRDGIGALIQLGQAFSTSDDAAAKMEIALKLTGKSSGDLIPIIENLGEGFTDAKKQVKDFGMELSDEAITKSNELDEAIDRLGNTWDGFMTKVAIKGTGATKGIVEFLTGLLDAFSHDVPLERPLKTTDEIVADIQRRAAEAKVELQKLREAQDKASQGPTPQMPPAGKPKTDSKSVGGKPEPLTEREKLVARLTSVLRLEATKAQEYADIVMRADEEMQRTQLVKELIDAGVPSHKLPVDLQKYDPATGKAPEKGKVDIDPKELKQTITDALKLKETLREVESTWIDVAKSALDWASVLDDTLSLTYDALQQGFTTVFVNMIGQGQTFASAMKTIARSVVDAWLTEFARIVAAKVFLAILNFATGGATAPLSGLGGGFTEGTVGNIASARRSGAYGQTVNIYAIDRAGVAAAFEDPRGTIRKSAFMASLNRAF